MVPPPLPVSDGSPPVVGEVQPQPVPADRGGGAGLDAGHLQEEHDRGAEEKDCRIASWSGDQQKGAGLDRHQCYALQCNNIGFEFILLKSGALHWPHSSFKIESACFRR